MVVVLWISFFKKNGYYIIFACCGGSPSEAAAAAAAARIPMQIGNGLYIEKNMKSGDYKYLLLYVCVNH